MKTAEMNTEILNDLVQINNDRINGYENALKELHNDNNDLRAVFLAMIDESRKCKLELATEVEVEGADVAEGTTGSGKIHRAWMDVKAVFTGHDRKSLLSNCEFGEDATQKAYTSAIENEDLQNYLREIISAQQVLLKKSHDAIKALRDAA